MINISSVEISQKTVKLSLNDKDKITITLTKDFSTWKLVILGGRQELTVYQLIEICNLIYSEKIIEESDHIEISLDGESKYIHGIKFVTDDITNAVKIRFNF